MNFAPKSIKIIILDCVLDNKFEKRYQKVVLKLKKIAIGKLFSSKELTSCEDFYENFLKNYILLTAYKRFRLINALNKKIFFFEI